MNIGIVLNKATSFISTALIPVLFALAIALFVWGVVQYFIMNADEEAKRSQGKQFIIWGIIALAVMVSVWGLVHLLGGTFGVNTRVIPGVCPPGDVNCAKIYSGGSSGGSPGGGSGGGSEGPYCGNNICETDESASCPTDCGTSGSFDCRLCSDPATFDEYECTYTCGGN